MNLKDVIRSDKVNFTGIESSYFLLGLLSAFENRFQTMADSTMKEISWKQFCNHMYQLMQNSSYS